MFIQSINVTHCLITTFNVALGCIQADNSSRYIYNLSTLTHTPIITCKDADHESDSTCAYFCP